MTATELSVVPSGASDTLVDLLDRVLMAGVVATGEVVIALAGIDLIRLDLRLLLTAVEAELERGAAAR